MTDQPLTPKPQPKDPATISWANRRMPLATAAVLLALSLHGLVLAIQDTSDATELRRSMGSGSLLDAQVGRLLLPLTLLIGVCGLQVIACVAGVAAIWRTQVRVSMYKKVFCWGMSMLVLVRTVLVMAVTQSQGLLGRSGVYTMAAVAAQVVGVVLAWVYMERIKGKAMDVEKGRNGDDAAN